MVARLRLFAVLVAGLAVLAACGTPQPPVTKVELSVSVEGTGTGTVTSSPAGINTGSGDLVAEFNEGTTVTLTAAAASGSIFEGFTGATCEAGSAANTCIITLDEATDVTATFTLVPSLTVVLAGDGEGAVTSSPEGIDTDAGQTTFAFATGTVVTLTATPAGDDVFLGFSGVTCEAGSSATTCVITFDDATTVTATFAPVGTAELTVNIATAGGATGSVTSDPAGIDVDTAAGSDSGTFQVGTTVTLTASVDVGTGGFAGWTGGDCDGLKTLVCEVVVGADEPAVTANFNAVEVLTVTVAAITDDAVEFLEDSDTSPANNPAGWVWAEWPRFDLGRDPNHAQTEVGLRFPNVGIPVGANVLDATLQLSAYGTSTGTTGEFAIAVRGQLATDAAGFPQDPNGDPSFLITGRTARTTASATWSISGAWAINTAYASPPITSIVNEIVALPGWTADGNVVLFLSNVDPLNEQSRRVWSFDGVGAGDPRLPTLLIEYVALP